MFPDDILRVLSAARRQVTKGEVVAAEAVATGGPSVLENVEKEAWKPTHRQVTIGEVVASQALVTGDPNALENCEREAWKPTHVNLVGS